MDMVINQIELITRDNNVELHVNINITPIIFIKQNDHYHQVVFEGKSIFSINVIHYQILRKDQQK